MLRLLFTAAAALAAAGGAQAQALQMQDLPDDVRATVRKELARRLLTPAGDGSADEWAPPPAPGSRDDKGCSMNIASTDKPGSGRRQVVVVATKPIVQLCNK